MELNQKIHEWLGKCWHEMEAKYIEGVVHPVHSCRKCHLSIDVWIENEQRPDYTTDPAAMLELIEAVRAKGFDWEIGGQRKQWLARVWTTPLTRKTFLYEDWTATADTLPMALARAVEKLIDAETTTEATDARFKSR